MSSDNRACVHFDIRVATAGPHSRGFRGRRMVAAAKEHGGRGDPAASTPQCADAIGKYSPTTYRMALH